MTHKKSNINIVHCPGAMNNIAIDDRFYTEDLGNIKVDNNISIVSIMNEKCLKDSYLAKQCTANNINLIIPQGTYEITKWKNTYKIDGMLEALENIKTPYVLFLDGRDVRLMNDLDKTFIDKFLSFNADIVFNGNDHVWPGEMLENEIGKDKPQGYWQVNYINAGVCIGKTSALKQFYTECKQYIINNNINDQLSPSEQWVVRNVATNTSIKIDTDDQMIMFASYFKYRHMED